MFRQTLRIFLVTVACSISAVGWAQDASRFRHAQFVEGEDFIGNRIRFPKSDGDVKTYVVCRAHATAKGRLKDTLCSSPDDPDRDFMNAVNHRTRSARLQPAMVDGVPQEVDFQFTVRFERTSGDERITVFYNNGHNKERLGEDYFGAQRYSPHVWPGPCKSWRDTDVVIEAATIDDSGSAREVNAMTTRTRIVVACRAALMRQLETGQWIPAMKDGQFIESVWMSPIVLNQQEVRF